MGLLNRATICFGGAVSTDLAIACFVVVPLLGLDSASLFIGVVIGLVVASQV